jgi:hypothetical protein
MKLNKRGRCFSAVEAEFIAKHCLFLQGALVMNLCNYAEKPNKTCYEIYFNFSFSGIGYCDA